MENKNIFQFDNSGWPDKGDALPEVFIKFPFKFDFTEEFLNLFRNKHTSTSFGYRWLYISDDKIFIHRGGRCLYQLMLNPDKLTHTAIYYFYDEVDELVKNSMAPMETLLMILNLWLRDYGGSALRIVRSVAYVHAIADALGVPVEFNSRQELKKKPVKDMMGYGTHHVPAGTWSDDTSMAIATLDSLASGIDYDDIMSKFRTWKVEVAYTATDEVFDMGVSTNTAISRFQKGMPALECGCSGENDNGNGSLMRIYPAVLYWYFTNNGKFSTEGFDEFIFDISALTHAHLRSKLACGIYAYALLHLLERRTKKSVCDGLYHAQMVYSKVPAYASELKHFARVFDVNFPSLPEEEIKSSGYVVATLEAAIWCLLNTESYKECVLKAVNLGSDTDTVAAVAGALAGCLYGLERIPEKWLDGLLRKDMIADICQRFTDGVLEETHKRKMVDTHGHYVFGIDDGASTIEMSVAMIRAAYKQGVQDIICTSHSWGNYQAYQERIGELRDYIAAEKIPVRLHMGSEIACSERTLGVIIDQLESGYLLPLGTSNYILLEFDPNVEGIEILRCVKQIMELPEFGGKMYKPVIAHIERYHCFQKNPALLKTLKAWNVPMQINAYSLVEEKNESTKELARMLLKNKLVTFVGSDAHRTTHRPPNIKSGVDYIYQNCDGQYADDICFRNAERYLLGADK